MGREKSARTLLNLSFCALRLSSRKMLSFLPTRPTPPCEPGKDSRSESSPLCEIYRRLRALAAAAVEDDLLRLIGLVEAVHARDVPCTDVLAVLR